MAVLMRFIATLVFLFSPTFISASPDLKQSLGRYFSGSAIPDAGEKSFPASYH